MKKIAKSFLFVLISLCIVLILRSVFPKNSGFLWLFFALLLLDAYLWQSLQSGIQKQKKWKRVSIIILYWFPLGCIFALMAIGVVIPFLDWYQPIRTYTTSFILIIFLSKLFPILSLLCAELIRGIKYGFELCFSKQDKQTLQVKRNRPLLISGWILGGIFFLVMLYGTFSGPYRFTIQKQTIEIPNLPPSFDGFRIVQFSDVHLGSWVSKKELRRAIQIMNSLHPDVIFFTGDMFNFSTSDGIGFEQILMELRSSLGIYAILGNHDYGDYTTWSSAEAKSNNLKAAKQYYHNLGWKLLLNSHDIIKKGDDSIAILGVENWGATQRFQRLGDVDKAQKGLSSIDVQLLLSHDPSHWDSIISQYDPSIKITFSGHTHGGQIGIDWFHFHWSPINHLYRHWCGLYTNTKWHEPQYLYVNQGLGCIGYAGRIGILPEITLITLKRH